MSWIKKFEKFFYKPIVWIVLGILFIFIGWLNAIAETFTKGDIQSLYVLFFMNLSGLILIISGLVRSK